MNNVLVDGTCGTAATEYGVRMVNLTGSASVTNSAFSGGQLNADFSVSNSAGGTLNRITFDGVTFGATSAASSGGGNLDVRTVGPTAGTLNLTVQNSRFLGSASNLLGFYQQFNSTGDLILNNNEIMNGVPIANQISGNTTV